MSSEDFAAKDRGYVTLAAFTDAELLAALRSRGTYVVTAFGAQDFRRPVEEEELLDPSTTEAEMMDIGDAIREAVAEPLAEILQVVGENVISKAWREMRDTHLVPSDPLAGGCATEDLDSVLAAQLAGESGRSRNDAPGGDVGNTLAA